MHTEMHLAGKEIDRLIAEKVMNWSSIEEDSTEGKRGYKWLKSDGVRGCYTPAFSTGIAEAWQIVEELTKKGRRFQLEVKFIQEDDRSMEVVKAVFDGKFAGIADSAPLAICRAALTIQD